LLWLDLLAQRLGHFAPADRRDALAVGLLLPRERDLRRGNGLAGFVHLPGEAISVFPVCLCMLGERGAAYMARAITIEELEAARDRYAEEIRKLEEMGPNPQFRITAAQISRLIETLEVLRDQCTAMISSYGSGKKS
jgi:hypothetical protein